MRRQALAAILIAIFVAPAPASAESNLGQQLGQLGRFWRGLISTPDSFRKATTPNPDATPNSVTINAYTPLLSNQELAEMSVAKVQNKWGKRGDIGIYFPAGYADGAGTTRYLLLGQGAEDYIKAGKSLRGIATVGMPVDDYGSAIWAKNVALVNSNYALKRAKKSRVIRRALSKIARQQPQLAKAARKLDLSSSGLLTALTQRAQRDKRLARALGVLGREITVPMAFVVNAGFADNEKGMMHYGVHKRRANESRRATSDKIVAKKVADLMFDWWMKALPKAKTEQVRIFDANHCAGVYDAADWLFALRDRLKREKPTLVKEVLRRTYSYDFGAGANRPEGVRHVAQIGARDMFGQLNTPTSVLGKATMVKANHMLNGPLGTVNPQGLPALKVKPFAEAFGFSLFEGRNTAGMSRKQLALRRAKALAKAAVRYGQMARQQQSVLKDLHDNSPDEDKLWTTFKLADANLRGKKAIFEAKARRARALSTLARLSARGGSRSAARSEARKARREQKSAEKQLRREVSRLGLFRNMITDSTQYKMYVHGGQQTAMNKQMERRGEQAQRAMARRGEAYNRAFTAQISNFYGRARAMLDAARQASRRPQRR